jgi:hypothetical protein
MLDLISKKQSFYLGVPPSYLVGEIKGGMTDTGKKDTKAIEQGLKGYFFSIAKPIADGLFGVKTTFKSNDFEMLTSALETLKTFDITSDEHLSKENKTEIVNKVFGLPKGEKGDAPEPLPVDNKVPPEKTKPVE